MNDTMGLIYDDDAAVHFGHAHTGLSETVVRTVLQAKDRYHLGLGILPAEAAEGDETPEAIRARHPDLFPARNIEARYLAIPLERTFVTRETSLSEDVVNAVLEADDAYMRKVGIID